MLPTLSPQEFVAKWRKVELKERSAAQSHFNDLCRLVGHLTPVEADPTFETFPFPWPPGREPAGDPRVEAIAQAARDMVDKRDRWLNPEGASEKELQGRTLTHLYNQRPTWLELAHRKLDDAVLDAYGWPHGLADEEILARLLALNLERSGG